MTDRPLNLRPHEVRAALDGRLSLIVRPLGPQPVNAATWSLDMHQGQERCRVLWYRPDGYRAQPMFSSLPFAIGDRLWCREAWRVCAWHYGNAEVALDFVDGPRKQWLAVHDPDQLYRLIDQSREDAQKANVRLGDLTYYEYTWPPGCGPTRWRPSITMPRWANRLTLTVKDVDVKRVQEITEEEVSRRQAQRLSQPMIMPGSLPKKAENADHP